MTERVLSYEQALEEVLQHARALAKPTAQECVALLDAVGRVLAAPVTAPRDHPPFDRCTRDGYAVRAEDLASVSALLVVGSVRAGETWSGEPLCVGQAIEIMTGAPLPAGADAVVMLEHVNVQDETLRLAEGRKVRAGEHVVARGSEARAGDVVLPAGRRIGAAEIAVAASCGAVKLDVFPQPKVAIVPTGDELIEPSHEAQAPPTDAQIYNSNSHALAALVHTEGAFAGQLKIVPDDRQELFERIAQGSMWDVMVLSGGVSMGKHDLVEGALAEFGAEFFFSRARIQPGKPIVFGRLPKSGIVLNAEEEDPRMFNGTPWQGEWAYFFGLPGNPISTQVCFHLFVAPLLRALGGETEIAPRFAEARLAEPVRANADLTRFLPAELTSSFDAASVHLVGWQGSGDLAANARANCYCVLPPRAEDFTAGETVRVLLR
jgi:molybdopterin molybdotransferase